MALEGTHSDGKVIPTWSFLCHGFLMTRNLKFAIQIDFVFNQMHKLKIGLYGGAKLLCKPSALKDLITCDYRQFNYAK